ncbi:Hypothetical protein CGB_L0080C [Cryptococcus gattii WM276]|uniref:DDE Tnp4 domain-containing protein n=1 Tax=Cryptococcus gattii serotype B (strain WM276 / ATCC MYA-4071) TaxID=367775 RepID=E6REG6_CRYGW|nr:Hypothetical protein CGB_L0080C [Cryptococcus gattii WM276]ADV25161.1 Hypothetical protein CGB_L0080C [Cryptococcus gattii WM276]
MPHLSKKQQALREIDNRISRLYPFMIKTLRMNYAEFRSLVALFGDHPIFKSEGRKPQAPPEVQTNTLAPSMTDGSVSHYTDRSIIAIASSLRQYITWPCGAERAALARELYAQYGISSCVSFIDGTDIVLHQAPSIGRERAHTMHSYKERYGYKVIAVVDHLKRFRYIWLGFSAACNDQMAQDLSDLHRNSDRFFSSKEYVLGDAGMKLSDTVLPLFKRERGRQVTIGPKAYLPQVCQGSGDG